MELAAVAYMFLCVFGLKAFVLFGRATSKLSFPKPVFTPATAAKFLLSGIDA
jgi:hypothetical protein